MKRVYLDRSDCNIFEQKIHIEGGTFHYLRKVLRMKTGDVFSGFDGTGTEYTIQIGAAEDVSFEGELLESKKRFDIETPFNLHLFQSIPKSGKMDSIIRDVSQLGVKKIVPVISKRVIGNFPAERISRKTERWRKIASESSRISGRELVTEISEVMRFEDAVKTPSDVSIIFWEGSTTFLKQIIQKLPAIKTNALVKIFVGPEGGYTEEEVSLAERCGAMTASIGKRILKVETASVIAAALTIYELENLP
jgi:16S rRNA (uracil1498-N3)-methyltransferase